MAAFEVHANAEGGRTRREDRHTAAARSGEKLHLSARLPDIRLEHGTWGLK